MDGLNSSWSSGFEFVDIEIITNPTAVATPKQWECDQCSLFYFSKESLDEHKSKTHKVAEEITVNCKYCNKVISNNADNRECFLNQKCGTCEYRCSECPKRFLRHSSLVNHENSHSRSKGQRSKTKKQINKGTAANTGKGPPVRKRKSEEASLELAVSNATNSEGNKRKRNLSRSPKKVPKLSLDTQTVESSSLTNVDKSPTKKNSSITPVPTQSGSASQENSLNYKPFSCHVCGDNFASDNQLLEHLKSHGDAAKTFKCKFCGDQFKVIYDMQYHLAICPLAEDDLESSILVSSPPKLTPRSGSANDSFGVRKRGRPKKSVENPSDNLDTSLKAKRGRPRKYSGNPTENLSPTDKENTSAVTSLKKKNTDNEVVTPELTERKTRPSRAAAAKHSIEGTNNIALDEVPENSSLGVEDSSDYAGPIIEDEDNSRRKLHSCPFPNCDFKFNREKALLCHMKNHKDDFEDNLMCHRCDIPFDDVKSLRMHISECKGIREEKDEDFKQNSKPWSSNSPESNQTFRGNKKSKGIGDFDCNICGRVYPTKEKLHRCQHLKSTENSSKDAFKCRMCSEKLDDEIELKKHFKSVHSSTFPFQCSSCHAEFDTEMNESKHDCSNFKMQDAKFECVICSKKHPSFSELYFHYSQDHIVEDQTICKLCNKLFTNRGALKEHNMSHREEQRYTCIFCLKTYSNGPCLKLHLKRHTNSNIYKCKICYMAFFDQASLFKHMLLHANLPSQERSHKCCFCSSSFTQKIGLIHHISNSHLNSNSTSLKCPVCAETKEEVSEMANHISQHCSRIANGRMNKSEIEWTTKRKKQGHNGNFDVQDLKLSNKTLVSQLDKTPNFNTLRSKQPRITQKKQAKEKNLELPTRPSNKAPVPEMGQQTTLNRLRTNRWQLKQNNLPKKQLEIQQRQQKRSEKNLQDDSLKKATKIKQNQQESFIKDRPKSQEGRKKNITSKLKFQSKPLSKCFAGEKFQVQSKSSSLKTLRKPVRSVIENSVSATKRSVRVLEKKINSELLSTANPNKSIHSKTKGTSEFENELEFIKKRLAQEDSDDNDSDALSFEEVSLTGVKNSSKNENIPPTDSLIEKGLGGVKRNNLITSKKKGSVLKDDAATKPLPSLQKVISKSSRRIIKKTRSGCVTVPLEQLKSNKEVLAKTSTISNGKDALMNKDTKRTNLSKPPPSSSSSMNVNAIERPMSFLFVTCNAENKTKSSDRISDNNEMPILTDTEETNFSIKSESEKINNMVNEVLDEENESEDTMDEEAFDDTELKKNCADKQTPLEKEASKSSMNQTVNTCTASLEPSSLNNGSMSEESEPSEVDEEETSFEVEEDCEDAEDPLREIKDENKKCEIKDEYPEEVKKLEVKKMPIDVFSGGIKEKRYFEPSLNLTKYSCTTCILSFATQEELLQHNTEHIF